MDFIELGEEQAKVFAYWYFLLRQPEQAAQKAGVQDGVLLLGDRRVRRELRRLRREFAKQGAEELAKLGLYRILFAQAQLIAGLPLENPSEYADLVCELMK